MEIDYRFEHISGTSAESFFTIGVRFDAEYVHHSTQECWCIHAKPGFLFTSHGHASWYTGIWQAPTGEVFISDANACVHRHPNPVKDAAGAWSIDPFKASLQGIWGLDARFVLTWGGPDEHLYRWDGATWSEMPHPGGWVREIRGTSRDMLYAVGHAGLISRWDGSKWTRVPHADTTLSSLVVVSEEQIFAAGPGGELLEGSVHGMSKLLQHDEPITALAWWHGELWVGTGAGLLKLVDGALVMVKDNLFPQALDGRGDALLIVMSTHLVTTTDGATFVGYPVSGFAKFHAGYDALWAPGSDIDHDHGDDP